MNTDTPTYRAVLQLSTNDAAVHKSLVQQLNNIRNAPGVIQLELVTHGPGIDLLLKDAPFERELRLACDQGVRFLVCANTLQSRNTDSSVLTSFVEIIPSALVHLIKRQSEGWSYIKAGF